MSACLSHQRNRPFLAAQWTGSTLHPLTFAIALRNIVSPRGCPTAPHCVVYSARTRPGQLPLDFSIHLTWNILFHLHHLSPTDARGIESVLGGSGGVSPTLFLVDYNQVSVAINVLNLPCLRCGHWMSVMNRLAGLFQPFSLQVRLHA